MKHQSRYRKMAFKTNSVNVEENGYLLLDVYSSTGMHSSHGIAY